MTSPRENASSKSSCAVKSLSAITVVPTRPEFPEDFGSSDDDPASDQRLQRRPSSDEWSSTTCVNGIIPVAALRVAVHQWSSTGLRPTIMSPAANTPHAMSSIETIKLSRALNGTSSHS